jgi:hypothetical protein
MTNGSGRRAAAMIAAEDAPARPERGKTPPTSLLARVRIADPPKAGHVSIVHVVVVLVVLGLAIWRVAYVLAGPDPDTDAYGHHAIARQILVNPKDLTVHWVWLPLFHYVQAGAILLGATLDTVRFANVAISAAVPLVLYATLRAGGEAATSAPKDGSPRLTPAELDPVPAFAAIASALAPIAMQMGTTGQTEPSFALLTMAAAWALVRGKMRALAAILPIAVLLRYEAWSIAAFVLGLAVLDRLRALPAFARAFPRLAAKEGAARVPWLVAIAPFVAIFAWAAIRRPVDGSWFWFLKGTREFANGALGAKSSLDVGGRQLAKDLGRYAVEIPWRVLGYPVLLAPFGVVRIARRGLRFCGPFLAVLGFVTFAWVMRSSLGLDRHFVALVPFYATLIAEGAVAIAGLCAAVVSRIARGSEHAYLAAGAARASVVAGLACFVFVTTWGYLGEWMTNWRHASEDAWPDRRALADWLHTLPPQTTIFCDEATIEVLSGLDRHRFDRVGVADPARVKRRAEAEGEVYVVSWAAPLKPMRKIGEVAYRPPGNWKDDEGLIVLRVRRAAP